MSLLKKLTKPSERNINIYYAVVGDEATRGQVAEAFNITRQRVGAIVRRVARWIAKKAAANDMPLNEQRYLAEDAHLHALHKHKKAAMEMFEKSQKDRYAPDDSSTPKKWFPAKPSVQFLAKAMDADEAIAETTIARAKVGAELHKAYKETDEYWQRREAKLAAKEARQKEREAKKAEKQNIQRQELSKKATDSAQLSVRPASTVEEVRLKSTQTPQQSHKMSSGTKSGATSVSAGGPALKAGDVRTTERADDIAEGADDIRADGIRAIPAPPAGAMPDFEVVDGERRPIWKNAQGETIWFVETYDFGEDTSRPIDSADGRCFSGKFMWRTEAEIEDEYRRRWTGQ